MIRRGHTAHDDASGTQVPGVVPGARSSFAAAPGASTRPGEAAASGMEAQPAAEAPQAAGRSARGQARKAGPSGLKKDPRDPWARYGWLLAAVWLVFLFYPIQALLQHQAPMEWEVLAWVGMGAFVMLYLLGFQLGMSKGSPVTGPVPLQWWCFGALIFSGALTLPALGFDAVSFLPFVMSFASYGLTRRMHWITLVVCLLLALSACIFSGRFMDYLSVMLIVVLLGAVNTVSTFLIRRSTEADALALSLATSRERESVARDVHDLMGHSLTVVKLKAQLARRLVDADPERAKAELADIETITAEAIAGVRATVTGLRSEGLAAQLEASRAALATAGVGLTVTGDPAALSPAQALPAGWILREATTNVLRHAGASRVRVRVMPGGISVEDDGVGLSGAAGNGLRGMAERAALSGGVCVVSDSELGGVKVDVTW